jgi:hypothetical protein
VLDRAISHLLHSYRRQHNQPYWKCSKLERDGYIYAQTCAYGNYVRVESDDWNQLPYPNTATYLGALVSNQTSVHHGLRGVAWY